MDITCISDLHGYYPELHGGDLLIVAGDLMARHTEEEWNEFGSWMHQQKYEKIVFISGNHDIMIEKEDKKQDELGYKGPVSDPNDRIEYLCDSGAELEGLKIWGSPWTAAFEGMNPHCMAFTCETDEQLAEKWALIPDDTDILITHSPPYGVLDHCVIHGLFTLSEPALPRYKCVGSKSLLLRIAEIKPRVHVFGHIHEQGGKDMWVPWKNGTTFVNASHVNERYQPVNAPVRIII